MVMFGPLETRRQWLKQISLHEETRKGPPRHPGYRHARNSSGGCGGGTARAKSNGVANRKQDGTASGVCFGAFSAA